MERTIMSAWSSFSSAATLDIGSPLQWNAFESAMPAFIHLDKNDLLRMGVESKSMDSLLGAIVDHPVPTDLEKCLIVWESLINVGDPNVDAFRRWNDGFCEKFDVRQEQKDIQTRLISEFGSIGVN